MKNNTFTCWNLVDHKTHIHLNLTKHPTSTNSINEPNEMTDLFRIGNLEPRFGFHSDQRAAEHELPVFLAIDATPSGVLYAVHRVYAFADAMLFEDWTDVVNIYRRYARFDDQFVRYTTRVIGWFTICYVDRKILQKRFQLRYE